MRASSSPAPSISTSVFDCSIVEPSLSHRARTHDRYEKKIADYNFGSLIRTDSMREYDETNTIFGALDSHGWAMFWLLMAFTLCACAVTMDHSNANTGEVSFMLCLTRRRNFPTL